jgi:hypothetical protein
MLTSGVLDVDQHLIRPWLRYGNLLEVDRCAALLEHLCPLLLRDFSRHFVVVLVGFSVGYFSGFN